MGDKTFENKNGLSLVCHFKQILTSKKIGKLNICFRGNNMKRSKMRRENPKMFVIFLGILMNENYDYHGVFELKNLTQWPIKHTYSGYMGFRPKRGISLFNDIPMLERTHNLVCGMVALQEEFQTAHHRGVWGVVACTIVRHPSASATHWKIEGFRDTGGGGTRTLRSLTRIKNCITN